MNQRLRNQVVVIVGAGGGLGSAIAEVFAAQGAILALAARRPTALHQLAEQLNAAVFHADLTDASSLAELRDAVLAHYGRIDVVINATGYDVRKPLSEHSAADLQNTFAINLLGAITLTQQMLPALHNGFVLHLGGFADGRLAFPFYSADVASRAGLRSFCESLNRELALQGNSTIVGYFSPSPADTPAEQPFHALWRRMGTPIVPVATVAEAVLRAVVHKHQVYIMGGALTRLFAGLNAVAPTLADRLMMRRYGTLMQQFFTGVLTTPRPTANRQRIGILLLILSVLPYVLLLVVPLLPFAIGTQLSVSAGLLLAGELIFWIGAALLGHELAARFRHSLNPWNWCCRSNNNL